MPRWFVENVPVWWQIAIALVCLPALTVALQWFIRHSSPSLVEGRQNAAVSYLGDLVQFSSALGPAAHGRVKDQVAAYARSVATSEWPAMENGTGSPATQQDFDRLLGTVQRLRVRDPSEQEFEGSVLAEVNDIGDSRQQRLDLADSNIPAVLWLVVILSSLGTLGFGLLLGMTARGCSTSWWAPWPP